MEVRLDRRVNGTFAKLRPLPATTVTIDGGFWATRRRANRESGLRHAYRMLHEAGNFHDLRVAAGLESGDFVGKVFMDSDVYKWLEAIAYELGVSKDAELSSMADEAIELIVRAQQPDGYLDSYYQVKEPDRKWADLSRGHELYCAGHLIEAALAFKRVLNDTRLFDVALRFVDHIDRRFGDGKVAGVPGHPEIELALVELYRETGEARLLKLARYFLDQRGKGLIDPGPNTGHNGPADMQDHVSITAARTVEGHSVRQLYLTAGVADVYLESGDRELLAALMHQWDNLMSSKFYVTGGVGSRHSHEAFSEPYELPNSRAYCETCAAIANIMWNWRLLLATGERRFADVIEHTMYNVFLSGVSLDSTRYFYCNPLLCLGDEPYSSRKRLERMEWPWTPCCPPNVMRFFAHLGHYLATTDAEGVQIHQYIDSALRATLPNGTEAALKIRSGLPWNGSVSVHFDSDSASEWTLSLRIPEWAGSVPVFVNGGEQASAGKVPGYVSCRRRFRRGDVVTLELTMQPDLIAANPRLESAFHSVAIKRGPIVYCLEQNDQDDGVSVIDAQISSRSAMTERWRDDLLGGIMTIVVDGMISDAAEWGTSLYRPLSSLSPVRSSRVSLTAIPYYAWANRGPAAMRVWIPLGPKEVTMK